MVQISEEKAVKLLQGRLAKFQINMLADDVRALLTLCRAQGWKFTARDPDTEMLDAVADTRVSGGTHTLELLWQKMWERA